MATSSINVDINTPSTDTNICCVGPDSTHVKLVSSEGKEFIVTREHALFSKTISGMLNGPWELADDRENVINFDEISTRVLEVVVRFLEFKFKYQNSVEDVPFFEIDEDICLNVIMAANFLDL